MKGLAFLRFIALAIVVAIAGLPPGALQAGAQRGVVKGSKNAGKNIAKGARKGVRKVSPAVAAQQNAERERRIRETMRLSREIREQISRITKKQIVPPKIETPRIVLDKTPQHKFVSIIRFLPEDYGRFDFRLPPLQPRSSADSCLNVECADSIAPELEPKMELPTDTIDTNVAP